ncbi:MAG TPA: protein translocase component YidC [Deltaproteobacteria bacterium]|nr:MAG: hypothetical protein A2Z79_01315 [Deltaproteobacteria bacterium GWA2_55_82]OIJ74071.1 MAG: hypothetical protein A2V21_307225 [Deltaproteobacteria bacterium GWC2_55_46]HBG46683.1 protein translocase component YidC [Deltaproteobacteria bacterium]HCY11309.1 protein translocase component YidC [Deltaproteobacteria bacterium]
MDKKVWIALILSMAVLFLYPYFIQQFYPQIQPQEKAQETQQAQQPATGAVAASPALPVAEPVKEELTAVETPLFKAVFSSAGGSIRNFELKRHTDGIDGGKAVNVTDLVATENSFKTQLDINGVAENILFTPSKASISIEEAGKGELTYIGRSSTGATIEKKYLFSGDTYAISTVLKASNPTASAISLRADTVLSSKVSGTDETGYHQGPIVKTNDKLLRQDEDEARLTGAAKPKWLGLENKYFLSALIPADEGQLSWITEVPVAGQSRATLQFPVTLAPGASATLNYNSFIGPKEYDRLVKQKNGLEEAIEFGWFDWIAKPFLVVLNFFERYLGNYGIAIIILTVIVKVLFYPLTKKSLNSMREMQKMQPQLAALKEKYKNDKDKMNKELMELYKRYKINPLGGCLPMLLQIPVFIALYEVLYVAIELRHAPFYLWIHDLSAKDPYYITPLLMGATMFIQQKMTPSTVDPAQQKIMMFMPVIFTFMFLNFPSGLVLYWLVNNVLSIGQQYFIYKTPARA